MKKLLDYFIGFFILIISFSGILIFMFSESVPARTMLMDYATGTGGIVYNHSSKDVKVSSDSYIGYIPARKNSIELGIKDIDALVIDKPAMFHGEIIENKVLKFCNAATIEVNEAPDGEISINEIKLTWLCKLANRFSLHNSVKEAFGQN